MEADGVADEAIPVIRDLEAALVQVVDGFAAITEVTGAQVSEVKAEAAAAREEAAAARQGAELAEDQAAQAIARSDQDRTARRQAEESLATRLQATTEQLENQRRERATLVEQLAQMPYGPGRRSKRGARRP